MKIEARNLVHWTGGGAGVGAEGEPFGDGPGLPANVCPGGTGRGPGSPQAPSGACVEHGSFLAGVHRNRRALALLAA